MTEFVYFLPCLSHSLSNFSNCVNNFFFLNWNYDLLRRNLLLFISGKIFRIYFSTNFFQMNRAKHVTPRAKLIYFLVSSENIVAVGHGNAASN